MKTLRITAQSRTKIIIGNDDNEYLITLHYPKWSTNNEEQRKLNEDPANLATVEAANKILGLTP